MEKRIPPYYQNFDGSHCLQCALRSALEYFHPEKVWTWEELDELTGKVPDKATWHMQFLANLGKYGYEVVCIENLNLHDFANDPETYLKKTFQGTELAYMLKNTDIEKEKHALQDLIRAEKEGLAILEYRDSAKEDIFNYLSKGYVIIHWVNSQAFEGEPGYEGHFILVYAQEGDNHVRVHDNGGLCNGQPQGAGRKKVDVQHLYKSSLVGNQTGGFYAIRPKQ